MPKTAEPWSLTSLREKLIKIGAKVVSHGRYVTFQMAEVAVPRQISVNPLVLTGTTPEPLPTALWNQSSASPQPCSRGIPTGVRRQICSQCGGEPVAAAEFGADDIAVGAERLAQCEDLNRESARAARRHLRPPRTAITAGANSSTIRWNPARLTSGRRSRLSPRTGGFRGIGTGASTDSLVEGRPPNPRENVQRVSDLCSGGINRC